MNQAPERVEGGRAWAAGYEPDTQAGKGYRTFLLSPEEREVYRGQADTLGAAQTQVADLLSGALREEAAAKKAKVRVKLVGMDGNVFAILGICIRAGRQAGWSQGVLDSFTASAKAGDYDHFLRTCIAWFDVR